MSYFLDLVEYPEKDLHREIARRMDARADGLCDYCGRKADSPPCKFLDRHRPKKKRAPKR